MKETMRLGRSRLGILVAACALFLVTAAQGASAAEPDPSHVAAGWLADGTPLTVENVDKILADLESWRNAAVAEVKANGFIQDDDFSTTVLRKASQKMLSDARRSKLRQAHLESVDLSGRDFSGALLTQSRFVDCDLTSADFFAADLGVRISVWNSKAASGVRISPRLNLKRRISQGFSFLA